MIRWTLAIGIFLLTMTSPLLSAVDISAVTIQCSSVRSAVTPELIAQAAREAKWLTQQLPGPPVPALPQVFEGFRLLLDACGIKN